MEGSTEHLQSEQLDCSAIEGPTNSSERQMEGAQRSEIRGDGQCESSSSFHRLPFEIVAYVFEFYVNDIDNDRKGAFPLGAICQGWRHFAWTIPHLWTTLDFHLGPKTTESRIDLAIEWLNRSGELPLAITIKILPICVKDKEPLCLPLIDFINQSFSRCRHLELSKITSLSFSRFSPLQRPSILQSLKIDAAEPREINCSLNLGSQVAPTELRIDGIQLSFISINWNNLTAFHAWGLYLDEVLQALILAPQMKSCGQYDVMNRWQPNGYKTVIHFQLEYFALVDIDDDADIRIVFDKLSFPNLKGLEFGGNIEFPTFEFLSFLNRSSCAIENLDIRDASIESTDLIDIAKALPSITHLTLYHPTYSNSHPYLNSFYEALCQDSRFARDRAHFPGDVALLPSLQDLFISTIHPVPWRYLPGICSRYRHDNSSCETPPAQHLKHISIRRENFEPDYGAVDDDPESHGEESHFFPTDLIDTWETFSELMDLRRSVELDLKIWTATFRRPGADLFEQSYKKLEATGEKAPDNVRESFERWTATTFQD